MEAINGGLKGILCTCSIIFKSLYLQSDIIRYIVTLLRNPFSDDLHVFV